MPNQALHRTAIPLRSIAAGELGRYAASTSSDTLRAIDAKRTINASRARSLVQRMEERNGTRPAVVY